MTELAREYADAPRAAAPKIAECVRTFDEECRDATAEPIDARLIAHAFGIALGVGDRLGDPELWLFNGTRQTPIKAEALREACCSTARPTPAHAAVIDGVAHALEIAVATEAQRVVVDPERSAAMRGHAVARLNTAAGEEIERARIDEQRAARQPQPGQWSVA